MTIPNPYPGNADPSLALTGVNYKPNPRPVPQPYYDPWTTGGPLPVQNQGPRSSQISYGPWVDAGGPTNYSRPSYNWNNYGYQDPYGPESTYNEY